MPTIFILFGFRYMFYSNDYAPIHVHILKDGHEAKYNVDPVELVFNNGFKKHYILLTQLSQVNFWCSNSAYSCTNMACRCEFPQMAARISSL